MIFDDLLTVYKQQKLMNQAKLKQFGLNENEIQLYIEVLKHGKLSITQLPKLTGINRTTVYSVVKKLSGLGLVAEDLGGKVAQVTALPPENLRHIIQKEQEQIDKQKVVVDEIIKSLLPFQSKVSYSVPRIRFVEENAIEKHLYEAALRWDESMVNTDPTWWGIQDHIFAELYKKWIDWYWPQTPKSIALKLLTNKSVVEKRLEGKYKQRAMKYWDKSGEFTSTIWITGDYVTMLSLRGKPHYLVEIHDPVMARNMRALFKGLWEEVK